MGSGRSASSPTAFRWTAGDTSTIDATVGTASVGIGVGLAGVAISVGISVAHQRGEQPRQRLHRQRRGDGQSVQTRSGGDITISATESATITAYGVAASAAIGAGLVGIGFAGAGVVVTNVILSKTNAYIENAVVGTKATADESVVDQGGDIVITATDTSIIDATVDAGSAAAGAARWQGRSRSARPWPRT